MSEETEEPKTVQDLLDKLKSARPDARIVIQQRRGCCAWEGPAVIGLIENGDEFVIVTEASEW